MNFKEFRSQGPNRIEVLLFFTRQDDDIILERVFVPSDGPQSKLLDLILYIWGSSPDTDEVSFTMAQDQTGRVIVTKKSLHVYVDHNKHLFGG